MNNVLIDEKKLKIFIYGPYASGKSYFAKILGKERNIPVLHLDELRFDNTTSLKRPREIQLQMANDFSNNSKWIIEGSWGSYAETIAEKSDYMLFVDQSEIQTYFKIIKRQLERINSNHIDSGLTNCFLQLKYMNEYYRSNFGLSREYYLDWSEKYADKVHTIKKLF